MSRVLSFLKKNISIHEVASVILLLLLIPLISKVNFMQNDDWNRTTSVVRFLSGDTSLLQVTATTFYVQGILGFIFSLIFGWQKLPFLTLIISVLNFYLFSRILSDHFKIGNLKSVIIALIFFFTPLHVYSSIGFMTENYTMFFMLMAIYFLHSYESSGKWKDFIVFNLAGVMSFFTKQNGIIVNFAYIPYLIIKKRYKEALIQSLVVGIIFAYYFLLFPQTKEMQNKGFIYENFSDWKYAYSLIYGIILVSISFALPFVFNFVINTVFREKRKLFSIFLIFVISGILFFVLNKNFAPGKISWEEYPYFENTFERTGFFPRSILGTKYHFKWNYDIFKYWDLGSKIAIAFLLPCLFIARKKLINIYSLSCVSYVVLMVFTETFFDRYLLPLIPLLILFFLSITDVRKNLEYLINSSLVIFMVFSIFLSTQMANDFVVSNNYVWGRSEGLVKDGVKSENIKSTMAWLKLYGMSESPDFFFSFSSPETEPNYLNNYYLFEEKSLGFKGSIFVNPMVYLYKMKENQ
jgi:hypothetical protein